MGVCVESCKMTSGRTMGGRKGTCQATGEQPVRLNHSVVVRFYTHRLFLPQPAFILKWSTSKTVSGSRACISVFIPSSSTCPVIYRFLQICARGGIFRSVGGVSPLKRRNSRNRFFSLVFHPCRTPVLCYKHFKEALRGLGDMESTLSSHPAAFVCHPVLCIRVTHGNKHPHTRRRGRSGITGKRGVSHSEVSLR